MTQQAAPVVLSLDDLRHCIEIIDTVSVRGAVKGEELQSVGSVRTKLLNFIKQEEQKALFAKQQEQLAREEAKQAEKEKPKTAARKTPKKQPKVETDE